MDNRLQQAIAAARAGKRDEARVLLDRYLADQPDDVHGIFLKSTFADSREERVDSLRRVMELDPDHRGAKLMLQRLGEPETPPAAEQEEVAPEEAEAADFEQDVAEAVAFEDEPEIDESLETVVQPVEAEEQPFDEIDATAVVLLADEIEEAGVDEAPPEIEEQPAEPAVDETLIAMPEDTGWEEEELPVFATDEDFTKPVEDEDFPPLPEDEEIPEWLTDEAAFKAEAALAAEDAEEEEMPLEMGELPDWLQEDPTDDWLSQEQIETEEVVDTLPEDWLVEEEKPLELPDEDFYLGPDDYIEPKKPRRVPKRVLEVVFGLLIVLAVLIMIGLVYVFLTM
jgi:hypothetical protein